MLKCRDIPKKSFSVVLSIILFFSGVLPSYSAHFIAVPSFSDVETVFFQPKPQPCKPPYFNPKGNLRNSIYVNAKIVNGRLKKGTYVGSWPSRLLTKSVLKAYPDCVIACVQTTGDGFLVIEGIRIKQYLPKNAKGWLVKIENGKPVKVYTNKGKEIPFWGDKDARNALFINAEIDKGKLKKGDFIKSFPGGVPKDFLDEYPDCVVAQCECTPIGAFTLGYKTYWRKNTKLKNKKGLTAHFINKELMAVYDKDGKYIYKKSDEDIKRHLYINAHIEDGKRVGGELVGNYSAVRGIPQTIYDRYSDLIVENVNLDKNGQLVIAKKAKIVGKEHAYKKGVTVVVKDKSIDAVYDKEGMLLYQKKKIGYKVIKLYSGAKIINGNRSGGTLAGTYSYRVPDDVWEKNPHAVVEVDRLAQGGGLSLARKLIWDSRVKLVGEKNIIVVRKNKEFVEAYNAQGEKIFSKLGETSRNALYINAQIVDGKQVGGELAGVYPHGPQRKTVEKYKNYVICNVRFDSKGTYKFLQKRPWKSFPPYVNATGNTIVIKDNNVYEAYDSEGRKIYAQGRLIYPEQLQKNTVHVGASYIDGEIVGGRSIGSYPVHLPKKVIKQYPDCIITNIQLNKYGGCALAHEIVWSAMAGYSRAQGITLIRENGEFIRAYDAEGKCIYTKKPLIAVYIDAQIIKGKRVGGKVVGKFKLITNKILTRYPNCIIEGLKTNDRGNLYIAKRAITFGVTGVGTKLVEPNEKGLLVHISNGAPKAIYNKEGRCIKADNITTLNCSVYTNRKTADIHEPKLVRNFSGSYPDGLPEGFLQEFPNCTVTHVPLDNKGRLRIGEKAVWGDKPQLSNAQNTSVIVLHGHVIAAFTEKGEYIYSKPSHKEGSRHSLYLNAWIEKGKRTGGLFVNAFPVDIYQNLIATYPDCIITHCICTSRGGLRFAGEDLWWEKEGYENSDNMTVVVKNGTPVMVFDGEGNEVWYYKKLDEKILNFSRKTEVLRRNNKNGKNTVFINSEIIEGRKARGDFVGNWPKGIPANVFDLCPDSVIANVMPDDEGDLFVGGILLLSDYGLESGKYTVCFEHARPVKIFDQSGKAVMFWGDKDAPNVVYKNAVMVNGKLAQGDFIKSFPEGISRRALINQGDCIIANCKLKKSFGFDFQEKEGLSAHFINGFLKTVYDDKGNVLFGRALKQFNNTVFTKPKGRDNIKPEGTFCGSYPRGIPKKVIQQHPDCLIFNCFSSSDGDVVVADQTLNLGEQYARMKNLTVAMKQGLIDKVVTEEDEYIYNKRAQNRLIQVFIGAEIVHGKRKGGSLIKTDANYLSVKFWEKYPDAVIELRRTTGSSSLQIGGQLVISNDLKNKDAEKITIVKKKGRIVRIFNKKGKEISLSQRILARNKLFVNARIEKGKCVGGRLIGVFSGSLTTKIINQYPNCIIRDVKLNGNGGFSMGRGLQWHTLSGHEYKENVTVEVKNRKAVAAYDKYGNKIYPHTAGSRNSVYLDATIKDGKRHGGRFVAAFPGGLPSEILKKNPDCIVTNVHLNVLGGYTIGRKQIWHELEGYENEKDVTVVFNKGKPVIAYDVNGKMIFVSDEKEHEQARKVFEELYASGNLENMLDNFGIEGTYRILLNVHGFTPVSIRGLIKQYTSRIKYKPKKRKFSFQRMRRMKIRDHIPRHAIEVLKDEIVENVYKDIIKDRRFLDKLDKESKNSKNNRFVREAYARAYTYYSDADQTTFKWINTKKIQLKLFQKIGIKFLMRTKKAILADMAGLGKTIQAIIAALNIRDGKGAKKVLIIAPMRSVNRVWKYEIETKTLGGQTVAVVNNESMNSEKQIRHMKESRFVITNYEAIRGDNNKLRRELLKLDFDFIIIDEAHRMRNETLQTDAIRDFDAEYKVLLTATPLVGRRISKVFNLLHWLDPATYSDKRLFVRTYSGTAQKIRQLNVDLKQIFLRRLKENVSDLPPKRYVDIRHPLNPEERHVYDMIAHNFLQWLSKYSLDNKPSRVKFITKFNKLRQAAIAAHLVEDCIIFDDGAKGITRVSHRARNVTLDGQKYTLAREKRRGLNGLKDEKGKIYPLSWKGNNKIITIGKKTYTIVFTHSDIPSSRYKEIDKIVEEKIKKGEKIVLFTNYRDVIHALEKRYRQYGVCYIMGNMTARSTDNEIEAFQSDPTQRIFLSTYPTGGESISLTAANNVIEVDKPITQKDRYQSNNRPDRWGQTKIINVYRLTSINTVDEDIEKILRTGDVIFRLAFDEDPSVSDITDELIEEVLKQLKYSRNTVQQILSYKKPLKPKIKKDSVVGGEMSKGKETIRFGKDFLFARLSKKDGSYIIVRSPHGLFKAMENLSAKSKKLIKAFCQQEFSREVEEKNPIKDTFFWLLCKGSMPELMHVDFDRKLEMYMEIAVSISSLLTVHKTVSVEDLRACVSNKELILETLLFMDKNNIFQLLSFIGFVDKQYYYNGALLSYEHPFQLTFSNDEITYIDSAIVNAIAPNRLIKGVSYNPDKPYESRANQYRKLTHVEEIRLAREAAKGNHAAQSVLVESCLKYIIERTKGIVYQASVKSTIAFILKHIDKNELYADLYIAGEYECIINLPGFYQECVYMRLEQYMERYLPAAINQELFKYMTHALREKNILDKPAFDGESEERVVDTIAKPLIGTRVYGKSEGRLLEKTAAYLLKKDMTQDEIDVFSMYLEGLHIDEISEKMHFTERQIGDIVLRIKSLLQEPGSPVRQEHMRRMVQAEKQKQSSH